MLNPKHAFWQALIVTIAIFIIGIFIGILIEGKRADDAQEKFIQSELFLMDSFTLSELFKLSDNGSLDCKTLVNAGISFADKVYYEALLFEKQGEEISIQDMAFKMFIEARKKNWNWEEKLATYLRGNSKE